MKNLYYQDREINPHRPLHVGITTSPGFVRPWETTFEGLRARLSRPVIGKKSGPGWTPATFGKEPTRRRKANVQALSVVAQDVEEKTRPAPSVQTVVSRCRARGWRAIIHTTHSHKPERPRFRLVLEPDRAVKPGELRPLVVALVHALGLEGAVDISASADPSRFFYFPRVPGKKEAESFEFAAIEGTPFPVEALLRRPKGTLPDRPTPNAEAIARALGGARRAGDGWLCLCPSHDDHKPSLSVVQKDKNLLVHCFAGCSQTRVIEALRTRGLWPATRPREKVCARREERKLPQESAWYPRRPFPLDVLPDEIQDSLRSLCAAFCVSHNVVASIIWPAIGAAVGRTVHVTPKASWRAPLIFWSAVIGESGTGKTHAANALVGIFHKLQREEERRAREMRTAWESLPREEKKNVPEPPASTRARFVTDLTLEGIRQHVCAGHGGVLCVQDELSAVVTGMGQYKHGGNDREAWLNLWNGTPANVVRVSGSTLISGARLSLWGGIQPEVFRRTFSDLYRSDGTLFRYLISLEPLSFIEDTGIAWDDHHRGVWESTLARAIQWGDTHDPDRPHAMIFDEEARARFFEWKNELSAMRMDLPAVFRGFIPKAIEYGVRLAGVVRLLHDFCHDRAPSHVLTADDFERARRVVEYHLGETEAALRIFSRKARAPIAEMSERTVHLARTLSALRPELDNGRLAVGYIHERFNAGAPEYLRQRTPRAMGALLRACGLTVTNGLHNANGRRACRCLVWDEKTDMLLEQSLTSLTSLPAQYSCGSTGADVVDPKSAKSANPHG